MVPQDVQHRPSALVGHGVQHGVHTTTVPDQLRTRKDK